MEIDISIFDSCENIRLEIALYGTTAGALEYPRRASKNHSITDKNGKYKIEKDILEIALTFIKDIFIYN